MRMLACLLTAVFVTSVGVIPVSAQSSHAASLSALDAVLQEHVASADADRRAVLDLLARPEIAAIAQGAGIDMRSAAASVTAMDPVTLAAVAAQARAIDQTLAGGQSRVTLSTTYIIIGLLILILLIVAID